MTKKCYDCPRKCGVDRIKEVGYCLEGEKIRIAKIIENFMWEEPCISGEKGALAIFFSGCNLRCEFCQNFQISHIGSGKLFTPQEFRELIESYDLSRFSSIDLITPTHFSSLLISALSGLNLPIPIVWNSGGYEDANIIKELSKVVDVFLPDFKYFDSELSMFLSKCPDYFKVASKAILTMRECKNENIFKDDILCSGVLIRHLVLPGQYKDSMKVLKFICENIKNPFVSIMGQFTPVGQLIKEKLKPLEYKLVLSYAQKLGLNNGYFQELSSASEKYVPHF